MQRSFYAFMVFSLIVPTYRARGLVSAASSTFLQQLLRGLAYVAFPTIEAMYWLKDRMTDQKKIQSNEKERRCDRVNESTYNPSYCVRGGR